MRLTPLPGIPMVEPGDDVFQILCDGVKAAGIELRDGDVVAIAQKIISKAEDCYAKLAEVKPSPEAIALADQVDKDPHLVELILGESNEVVRTRPGVVIVEHRLGYVHANAGIDRSNIEDSEERVLLLPQDPDGSAQALRERFREAFGLDIRIIVNDSAGRAWRNGTMGFAIGTAGFEPVVDMVGSKDLTGRPLEVTSVAVADELAAAASFLMGQADEAQPVVVISGANLISAETGSTSLIRAKHEDLFR